MTMTLDHSFEKACVLHETRSRVAAMAQAKFLNPSQREAAVTLAITSVFRYSAGLIPWTTSELETLHRLACGSKATGERGTCQSLTLPSFD